MLVPPGISDQREIQVSAAPLEPLENPGLPVPLDIQDVTVLTVSQEHLGLTGVTVLMDLRDIPVKTVLREPLEPRVLLDFAEKWVSLGS